jgi:hypothetical protein
VEAAWEPLLPSEATCVICRLLGRGTMVSVAFLLIPAVGRCISGVGCWLLAATGGIGVVAVFAGTPGAPTVGKVSNGLRLLSAAALEVTDVACVPGPGAEGREYAVGPRPRDAAGVVRADRCCSNVATLDV